MTERILLVDDEPLVLDGYRRTLRSYDLSTAAGPHDGLVAIEHGSFAVVVSDLQMPDMDGIDFLSKVRERSPDTVRMMLTGQADLAASIEAVNRGRVFRFLTKPCPSEDLALALDDGLTQFRLIRAEKELLEGTVAGAVDVLVEVMGLADPAGRERTARVRTVVRVIAQQLGFTDTWEFELAGSLCLIGTMTLPDDVRVRAVSGRRPRPEHESIAARHPETAATLLSRIPRLERVAEIVRRQMDPPRMTAFVADDSDDTVVGVGALALHAALEHDALVAEGLEWSTAARVVASRHSDPLTQRIAWIIENDAEPDVRWRSADVRLVDLTAGMVFTDDVHASNHTKLVPAGTTVTPAVLERLLTFAEGIGVTQPLAVRIPHYA